MEESRVHGSIFYLLKKFVTNAFPPDSWEILMSRSGLELQAFTITENYPISFISDILTEASKLTNLSAHQLMEQFGRYLVEDLFTLYKDYIDPSWRTYQIILHTETVMHGAVRKLNSTANPPVLNVSAVNDKLLIIDYYSHRRMAALAIGIIKGIADFYGETNLIIIRPTTELTDERVQIRLDFIESQGNIK